MTLKLVELTEVRSATEELREMKGAFDKIAAGLEDAIAFAEGRKSKAVLVRPVDIKAVRERRP